MEGRGESGKAPILPLLYRGASVVLQGKWKNRERVGANIASSLLSLSTWLQLSGQGDVRKDDPSPFALSPYLSLNKDLFEIEQEEPSMTSRSCSLCGTVFFS